MTAFQNSYEKYLSVDEVSGGALTLRGDSDEVGFKERFWVRIQSKYQREANEEEKKKKEGEKPPQIGDEKSSNHMFQAWGAGRSVVSDQDKKELKRARKEGRLAEAMLDRRAKLKRCATLHIFLRVLTTIQRPFLLACILSALPILSLSSLTTCLPSSLLTETRSIFVSSLSPVGARL
jgi:hypothetical protein